MNQLADGGVTFEYQAESGIPPIPNAQLVKLGDDLDFDPVPRHWRELEHSHWAVKDRDLFKALYRSNTHATQISQVLKFSDAEDPHLVAVMMPFVGFDGVYDSIKKAVQSRGLVCQRADEIWRNHKVMDDIAHLISSARVVICDFTLKNPNVFYETGIAHAIGKSFIPITQSKDDVPFDLQQYRYIQYLNNAQGRADLERQLSERLSQLIAG